MVHQVRMPRFPSGLDWDLVRLNRRLSDIDGIAGFDIEQWTEDGLGPARGLCLELPSGRIIALMELDYLIERGQASGPDILVDGGEAAREGFAAIATDVLAALGLDDTAIAWQPDDIGAWSASARRTLEDWQARIGAHEGRGIRDRDD